MRADTEGKHEMGKRFAILIGVAAAGVMALGAQTGAAAPDVVKYDTRLTITKDRSDHVLGQAGDFRGQASAWTGRQVILFKQRPGADRKLGAARSEFRADDGRWHLGRGVPAARSTTCMPR